MQEIRRRKISSKKWSHKYPRTRIENKGMNNHLAGWYEDWWERTLLEYESTKKFLIANKGRHIDKVYPEFLNRLRKGTYAKGESLEQYFLGFFGDKDEVKNGRTYKKFYLSNGIINYVPRRKFKWNSYYPTNFTLTLEQMMPYIKLLECTDKPVYIGDYFIDRTTNKTQVYIGYKSMYPERYTGYRQVEVSGYGKKFQVDLMLKDYPTTRLTKVLSTIPYNLSVRYRTEYVFLIKSNRKKSLTK